MIELNRILCPIDFSPFSERALMFAMRMANWSGARLRVLHVIPVMPASGVSELAESSRALTIRNLQAVVARHHLADVEISVETDEAVDASVSIIAAAEAFDADVIITGSHGRTGMQRALLGSVVESLLHKSPRPVLTVPSHTDPALANGNGFSRIVCAVDFAAASLSALAVAFALAEEANAKLTLLHVIALPPLLPDAPSISDDEAAPIRAAAEAEYLTRLSALVPDHARDYCAVQTAVLEGGVSRQILRLAAAEGADLIVLGVHGRTAFDLAFFGSNSKDIIRQAHCPVLVVPVSRRVAMRAAS